MRPLTALLASVVAAVVVIAPITTVSAAPATSATTGMRAAAGASTPTEVTPAPDLASPRDPITVAVTAISPEVVRPGDTLTVTATFTNTTDHKFTGTGILSIERILLLTRSSVSAWTDGQTADPAGRGLDAESFTLRRGASKDLTFTASAGSLALLSSIGGAGPRGIAVTVEGTTGELSGRLGAYRTFVLWQPVDDDAIEPVSVSVLTPVTGRLDEAATLTAPGGRLANVLAATESASAATWIVDPALVLAAQGHKHLVLPDAELERIAALPGAEAATDSDVLPVDDTAGGDTAGGDTAGNDTADSGKADTTQEDADHDAPMADWAARLLAGTAVHQTFALPVFDTDVDVIEAAAEREPSVALSTAVATMTAGWRDGLTLPAADEPSVLTLGNAVRLGERSVVARSGYLPPDLSYTPTAVTTVETVHGDARLLVADAVLTELLTAPEDSTPVTARQRLLAELAVLASERPAEHRFILIALPRDWDPTPDIARAQLEVLDGTPWAASAPVSQLLTIADPRIDRQPPAPAAATASRSQRKAMTNHPRSSFSAMLSPDRARTPLPVAGGHTLHPLPSTVWLEHQENLHRLASFATITADPASLTTPFVDGALALAGIPWEADPAGRATRSELLSAAGDALLTSQSVVIGSTVNLISAAGALPISLRNDLDVPVTVLVELVPDDPRLSADEVVSTNVLAQSEMTIEIPVHAVGSGDVSVGVRLLSSDGTVLARSSTFEVRVRAGWENVGTGIIAVGLFVLLVLGIWRTIRRGRSKYRTTKGPGDTTPDSEREGMPAVPWKRVPPQEPPS